MTSNINPNNINGAYPVAGQDNNSQGFRTNFTNTATNFQYAADEITDLQNKVILSAQLNGGNSLAVQNNLQNAPLTNALISDFATPVISFGTLTGTVTFDYTQGHYQTVTAGAPLSLNFINWPIAGQYGAITVAITITDTSQTVTFPSSVDTNLGIVGLDINTNIISFAVPDTYVFTFSTSSNGTSVCVDQNNTKLQPFNASAENVTSNTAISLGVTTSYANTAGGEINTTLAYGAARQIKVLVMSNYGGNMTCEVANAGWNSGNVGNIVLSAQGQACTLQLANSSWYCIGNNGAEFS